MTFATEKRDSRRFKLEPGSVRIVKPAILSPTVVADISASGTKVVLPTHLANRLTRSRVVLDLDNTIFLKTAIFPARRMTHNGQTMIGTRFHGLGKKNMGGLCGFLAEHFLRTCRSHPALPPESTSERPIMTKTHNTLKKDLLRYYCILLGNPLTVHQDGQTLRAKIRVINVCRENNRHLIYAKPADSAGMDLKPAQICTFTFPGENAVHCFQTRIDRMAAGTIRLEMPAVIVQSGFRYSLRARTDPGQPVNIRFDHPRLPGKKLKIKLWDVGAVGFSFPMQPEKDILFPGDRLARCRISLPDGPVSAEGTLNSIRRHFTQWICGFQILRFGDESERIRWMCFVFKATHDRLEFAGHEDGPGFWRILRASKYVSKEVTPELVPQIKTSFLRNWQQHCENHQLNRHLMLFHQGEPIATASMNLLYPNTSLSHHVSIDHRYLKSFFDIGRELICGLQYITRHLIPTRYYVSYFYADKAYNRMMFKSFINRYPLKEDYVYDRYLLYKCRPASAGRLPVVPSGNLAVVDATEPLLGVLSRHLQSTLPALELDAFAYDEEQIDLKAFSRQCRSMGYERKRKIFFAVRDRQPVAALIAECGDEGLNVFNLVNCCWVVNLTPEPVQPHGVLEQLLSSAIGFYRRENKSEFIWFERHADQPDPSMEKLGIYYLTDGMRWLGNDRIASAYLHYVRETLGMLRNRLRPN